MQAKILISLAALVGSFFFGYSYCSYKLTSKYEAAERARIEAQSKADAARQKASDLAAQAIIAELDAESTRAQVITKEIYVYASNPANHRCNLSADWLLHHNRSASDAPAGVDAPGGGIKDTDALIGIDENYATCRLAMKRLQGWKDWCTEVGCNAH